jgi:hypothetical protein
LSGRFFYPNFVLLRDPGVFFIRTSCCSAIIVLRSGSPKAVGEGERANFLRTPQFRACGFLSVANARPFTLLFTRVVGLG